MFVFQRLFKIPKKYLQKLKFASPHGFESTMKRVEKAIKCRRRLAYCFVWIVFAIGFWYVLLFTVQTGWDTSMEWAKACIISIVMDIFVWSVLPSKLKMKILISRYYIWSINCLEEEI